MVLKKTDKLSLINPYTNQTQWISDLPVESMRCFGIWRNSLLLVIDNYQKNIPSKIISLDAGTGRKIFQLYESRKVTNLMLTYYGVVYETITDDTEKSVNVFSGAGGFCWWKKTIVNNEFINTEYEAYLLTDLNNDNCLIKGINIYSGKFKKWQLKVDGLQKNNENILFTDYSVIVVNKEKNSIACYY